MDLGASTEDTEPLWNCSQILQEQSLPDRCFMVDDGDEDFELTQSKDDLLSTATSMNVLEKRKDYRRIDLNQLGPSPILIVSLFDQWNRLWQ